MNNFARVPPECDQIRPDLPPLAFPGMVLGLLADPRGEVSCRNQCDSDLGRRERNCWRRVVVAL